MAFTKRAGRIPRKHTYIIGEIRLGPRKKNEWLKAERNISFEEIALLLSNGIIWRKTKHPNQKDYSHQEVFLVPVENYIYFVPYVIDGDTIFLKTAFPHRKATKDYLKEKGITHE